MAIPSELKSIDRWVCWERDLEGKKKPINPRTKRYASVTNPRTWNDYEYCIRRAKPYDGLGLILNGQDGLIGLDFDKIQPEAIQPVIERLDSYTELSPSGNGVRIFLYADVKLDRGNRAGRIEVYQTERFLTVTGNVIHDRPVAQRTEQFQSWYNETFTQVQPVKREVESLFSLPEVKADSTPYTDILERIWKFDKKGDEHKLRFEGIQPESDKGDRSLTDYRLAQCFSRWLKDFHAVKALMLSSGLVRSKWFELRGDKTWLDMCVLKALRSVEL